MLKLETVSKYYKKKKVVNEVSFTVDSGQILGLIGSNGAGKSTCISMISTLIKPDGGSIYFDEQDISAHPEAIRRCLGYVPQDIALYEELTGLDNMKFWGKNSGVRGAALASAIKEVCQIIDFDDELLKKRVREYSGGMKRRLNIGVALLNKPKLVILDEPTTGIDIKSSQCILEGINKLKEQGTAVIYVGHYLEEVEQIATHLCVMEQGRMLCFGTKEELLGEGENRISLTAFYRNICAGDKEAD